MKKMFLIELFALLMICVVPVTAIPAVSFNQPDTALCQYGCYNPPISAVVSGLGADQKVDLQLTYQIIHPTSLQIDKVYIVLDNVGNGEYPITPQMFGVTCLWPGIPSNWPASEEKIVEIHFGANLLDPDNQNCITQPCTTGSNDYYWYPWVCEIPPVMDEEWIWAVDGWDGWSHTASWSGTQVGPCSEYGPFVEDGVGKQGIIVNLIAGSTSSAVERTFTDPTGPKWNSLLFKGSITASDVPRGRWMEIYINGQKAFYNNALSNPPGNGQDFEIQCYFPKTRTVDIKISQGQNPAWGPYFGMNFFSLTYDTLKFKEDLEVSDPESPICIGSMTSTPTSAPEFPSIFLPITIIISFLGAVLYFQRTREH